MALLDAALPWPLRPVSGLLAERLPLSVLERLVRRDLILFYYHAVSAAALPHVESLYAYKSPAAFEEDVRYLKRRYRTPTWTELCSGQGPGPAAMVTFDDGLRECHEVVRPILLRHGMPCVFFVVTGALDNAVLLADARVSLLLDAMARLPQPAQAERLGELGVIAGTALYGLDDLKRWARRPRGETAAMVDRMLERSGLDPARFLRERRPYLTRAEVQELARDGFTIGAHGRDHRRLGEIDRGEAAAEIVESCREVQALTGQERVPFAFPYGGDRVDRGLLREVIERHPFVGPFFDTKGVARDEPLVLNRICGDHPVPALRPSNLPELTRRAYARYLRVRLTVPPAERRRVLLGV